MRDENAAGTRSAESMKRVEYNKQPGEGGVEQQQLLQQSQSQNQFKVDSDIEMQDEEMREDVGIPDHDLSRPQSPTSQADFDEVGSVDGSIGSRANYECSSHRNRALVINRLVSIIIIF